MTATSGSLRKNLTLIFLILFAVALFFGSVLFILSRAPRP